MLSRRQEREEKNWMMGFVGLSIEIVIAISGAVKNKGV